MKIAPATKRKPAATPRPFLWPVFYATDQKLEGIGPNLNFIRRDELNDPRPNYTKGMIEQLAGRLGRIIPPPLPPTPGDASCTPFEGALAATVLREIASNPDALAALNRSQATAGGDFLALNHAVHYHVKLQIDKASPKKGLQGNVAVAWGVTAAHVKDGYTKHKAAARQLVDSIVKEAMSALPATFSTREDALRALDSDMGHRAIQTQTKRRRKKSRRIKNKNLSA